MTSNPFQALALQLMSERGFTILPDGSIHVDGVDKPAPVVNIEAHESQEDVDTDVDNTLCEHVDNEPQAAATPDAACVEANVDNAHVDKSNVDKHVDKRDVDNADVLTGRLQEVYALFVENTVLKPGDVAERLGLERAAAYNLLGRLVAKDKVVKIKGRRGCYTLAATESVADVRVEPHVDSDEAPKGPATMASNREERVEPSNYSKSITSGKSLIKSARVKNESLCKKTNKRNTKNNSIEYDSGLSDDPIPHNALTPSPAPAVSPKPLDVDPDELDEDERDAYDAEEFAVSGHAPIRLELPKHKRPRPRFSPLPTPRRTPYSYADAPVVVEDDDEGPNNGYDPD